MESARSRIGIICPCVKEYQACTAVLGLSENTGIAGRPVSSRTMPGLKVFAVRAGPGKINCASTTQLVVDRLRPTMVFDVGAAGSLTEKVAVNDIVCVRQSFEYDVIPLREFPKSAEDLTSGTVIAGLTQKSLELLRQWCETILTGKNAKCVIGDIACGEQDVRTSALREQLFETLGAIACDWETSAVLKTVTLNGLPAMGFRVITDNADESMGRDFRKNLGRALHLLFTFLARFLYDGYVTTMLDRSRRDDDR